MGWRTIVIENSAKLSLKNNSLVIQQAESITIPLEDIDSLVLDGEGIVLSKNLLVELSKFKINTIICDDKHLPSTTILAYSQASRGTKTARAQLDLPASTRKQLWRKIIMQKIQNQADVLACFNLQNSDLLELSKTVRSGDVSNNEALAARLYFSRLFEDATRRKPTWYNAALNYGYAIVRSNIARSVAARGLISMIGLNHHSELNQYNLVDDLIEPFRAVVDQHILADIAILHSIDTDDFLTRTDRHAIIDILNKNGIIKNKKFSVKAAVDIVVDSFVTAILEDNVEALELPEIIH